jgi:hypothetical protein
VTEDIPLAPLAHEGLDPVSEPKSAITEISEAVRDHQPRWWRDRSRSKARDAVEHFESREAPLGSLLIAFRLGVAVARRR